MDISFEPMSERHRIPVIDIFNYYVENSFSAYAEKKVLYDYYNIFIEKTKGYPAYAIKAGEDLVGFCFLTSYNPLPSFNETAQITYFIDKEHTGKGIGKIALKKLEDDAKRGGIRIILAHISSLNSESIAFHLKNGFRECGRFEKIIRKKDRTFDIIWMQKSI